MSVRYDKLVPALKRLLEGDRIDVIGRSVAFIRRLRQLSASSFVWAVVLSRFGSGRPGFEQARQWYARLTAVLLWPRPFQVRFKSPATVRLFQQTFDEAVAPWRTRPPARHPLARIFPDIVAWDSTLVQVADELRPFFKDTRAAAASLKVLLGVSIWGLLPVVARIVSGNQHDMISSPEPSSFRPGSLLLLDKGFVAYARLRELDAASLFFVCPMRLNGIARIVGVHQAPVRVRRALYNNASGVALRSLLAADKRIRTTWDLRVLVRPRATGAAGAPIELRLVIVPGPGGKQRPYLTNLTKVWTPKAIAELYRLRWQVEIDHPWCTPCDMTFISDRQPAALSRIAPTKAANFNSECTRVERFRDGIDRKVRGAGYAPELRSPTHRPRRVVRRSRSRSISAALA